MSKRTDRFFIGTLNDKPLRFFQAPLREPHLPWHSYDDLMVCIGVNQFYRNIFLKHIRDNCSRELMTTSVGSEIVIIAPYYAGRWFIKNIRGTMRSRRKFDLMYRAAVIDAHYAFTQYLPAAERERLFLEAFRNTDHAETTGYAA